MSVRILTGDCRTILPTLDAGSVHACVTSPPYFGLRDYGVEGQIGLGADLDGYVADLVAVFREVRRVLRDDGTLWLNLGDTHAGSWGAQSRSTTTDANDLRSTLQGGSRLSARQIVGHPKGVRTGSLKNTPGLKAKDLCGVPWRVAFALQADGWWLRSEVIWAKPNPMPSSVLDRPTTAHEQLFLLAKSRRYYYDAAAIAEPAVERRAGNARRELATHGKRQRRGTHLGSSVPWSGETRNKRSVWTIPPARYGGGHFATFPPALVEPCILAGAPGGGVVLDPFAGTGTVGEVAALHGRSAILVELNPAYVELIRERLAKRVPLLAREAAE